MTLSNRVQQHLEVADIINCGLKVMSLKPILSSAAMLRTFLLLTSPPRGKSAMKALGYQQDPVHTAEPSPHFCQAPWWSRSPKTGCALRALWTWVQRHAVNGGVRGVTTTEAQRAKAARTEFHRQNQF